MMAQAPQTPRKVERRNRAVTLATIATVLVLSGAVMLFYGAFFAASLPNAIYSGTEPSPEALASLSVSSSGAASASSGAASSSAAASAASSSAPASSGNPDSPEEALSVFGESTITSASADDARAQNLEEATAVIDGLVIRSGEIFSLNDVLGNTAVSSRYAVASESAEGAGGAMQGGGVCQVAAALFDAAVQADFEIVERHAHEVPCDYVAVGLDAEIVFGQKDLKIRNTSDGALAIHAFTRGQTVTVQLTGKPRDDGKTIVTMATIVEDGSAADAEAGDSGNTVTVETKKVVYEGGVAQSAEVLFKTTYRVNASFFVVDKGATKTTK